MAKAVEAPEKVTLTLTVDKNIKEGFEELSEDIGLSMSALLASMMTQAVRKHEVKLSSLDVNGFTPKEAAELLRRWKKLQAERDKLHWEEMNRQAGQ